MNNNYVFIFVHRFLDTVLLQRTFLFVVNLAAWKELIQADKDPIETISIPFL